MRIIYIHQYFVTPQEGGATRSYYLAKGMVEKGIEVEMITSHNKGFYDLRLIDGIKVHYLPVSYYQEFGFVKRVWSFGRFVKAAKSCIQKLPRPDYFYISSTPLTTGLIGLWAKRKFAIPYIFEVRDLWPDAPIQVGAIKSPLLKKVLYALENRIYKHALKIIALSPGIAENIRKKAPQSAIHTVPNFVDLETFYPKEKNSILLRQFGLKNSFTIAYAGAIGRVNAVSELLDIAKIAQDQGKDYQFVVMGKGSETPALLQQAKKMQLSNFFYFPFGTKQNVSDLLSCADMAFISFSKHPVLKTNSPNKFFDALGSGKAILVNHKGWVFNLVKSEKLGLSYPANRTDLAFAKIDALAQNPDSLHKMQERSRSLAIRYFSKETAINRLLSVIDDKQFGKLTEDGVYILTA